MHDSDQAPVDLAHQEARHTLERLASAGTPARRPSRPTVTEPASQPAPASVNRPDLLAQHWSEQTLRGLLEALPDAMVVIDRQGVIVLVNQQTERLFAYHREELLGRPIEVLVPERFRTAHVGHRHNYFTQPRSRPMGANLELFGRRKNGDEFPVEISLSPLQTEQGLFATSVIRDISKRKRDEAKFRTLVENIPAVTFIAPLDESVPELYVSPQIEKLLGFTQREWLEDPVLWHRQLHPDDRERWNLQFAPTCASGKPFEEIFRFVAKDGRVVWVHGSATVVRDEDGKPSFLQGVAFDLTDIKNAEAAWREAQEALRRNNVELEQRVRERTEALAQSMTELQEKTAELEQFAYVASHDLRQPLRSLVSYPEKLAKSYGGKISEEADKWISQTIAGATRMRQLIENLLQYSRVVRRERVFKPTDCTMCARGACANLQADIEDAGGQVTVGELPTVLGNPDELLLLFQNLIGNGIKFRDRDRPIQVEVGARPENDNWLLWVRDNGIGIETKYFSRIFVLGERLNAPSKYPGTGYGLHICEKIIEGHRGRIWVESQPGQGSTFFFTLPVMAHAVGHDASLSK